MSDKNPMFENVTFLNEDAFTAIVIAGLAGAVVLNKIISNKNKKKKNDKRAAENAAKAAEISAKYQKDLEIFSKDAKKYYGIELIKADESKNDNNEIDYKNILNDSKVWASKIANSKIFKDYCNEIMQNEELMDSMALEYKDCFNPSYNWFKSTINVKEGINGIEESIQILDGSQQECIQFGWVCQDISRMISYKYGIKTSTGDGDEGHIYY